ncbi:MAG: hypothetical protein ACHQ2Z_01635 [Elusimicrobiota bacterium]
MIGGAPSLRAYPDFGLLLLRSPRFYLCSPVGCLLGAYLCDRYREERRLDSAEGFMRGWMFWERGGAL